ncbi:MAG: hypothetical protein U1F77_01390 [Kiritimatiellia bacterium]
MYDSDADGMRDGYETLYQLNPLLNDASGDVRRRRPRQRAGTPSSPIPTPPTPTPTSLPDNQEVTLGTQPDSPTPTSTP